jgi:tRNA G37 N-methylase TrmD
MLAAVVADSTSLDQSPRDQSFGRSPVTTEHPVTVRPAGALTVHVGRSALAGDHNEILHHRRQDSEMTLEDE